MSEQRNLFDPYEEPTVEVAHTRRTDPETSHEAAASVDVVGIQAVVLQCFRDHGAMTHDQLCSRLLAQMKPSTARGRCSELVDKGLVKFSGRYFKPPEGHRMRIWELGP